MSTIRRRADGRLKGRPVPPFLLLFLLPSLLAAKPCTTDRFAHPHLACRKLPRPQDQIWLISTRDCSMCDCHHAPKLKHFRYHPETACGQIAWQPALDAEFMAEGELAESGPTVFFVHGNRISRQEARQRGLAVYTALVQQAVDDRPIRFVIWSWPSDRICGPLKDARIKAQRSDLAAYQLACVLNGMDPHEPVSLLGFSYGARVITGALHLVAGGSFHWFALERPVPRELKVRAVLWTAALDDDWLLPGCHHGKALSQVDRMLLLNNSCDRAMKWYPLVDRSRRRSPLGRCGVASLASLGADRSKIEQRDVCCQLGRIHDMDRYLEQPGLMARAWTCLAFGERRPRQSAAAAATKREWNDE